jgi:hypothetical protein
VRRISSALTVALAVLLVCKFTNSPALPWWQVLAPVWLPIAAAFTLPLLPAYRRYAMRRGWVGGESAAAARRPATFPAAPGDCADPYEDGYGGTWFCGRPLGHAGDHELHGRTWPRHPPVMRRRA